MNSTAVSSSSSSASGPILLTVERGMQVLRAFRSDQASVSNTELVRRTGLSKATVYRLTSTLLDLGFIRHVPGGREFELATGPFPIGQAMIGASELLTAAEPLLQDLADALGVSVALGTPDGLDMLYVAYRASRSVVGLRMGVGSLLPMGTTAIGHAYLWGLPERERAALLQRITAKAGARRNGIEAAVERSFIDLQEGGACGLLGTFQRDAYAVALPVRIGRARALMALSCGKVDRRPDLVAEFRRIVPLLKSMAGRLERSLSDVDTLAVDHSSR